MGWGRKGTPCPAFGICPRPSLQVGKKCAKSHRGTRRDRGPTCPHPPAWGPSPHGKPLELFREMGCGLAVPHSGIRSQVSTGSALLPIGGAPWPPSPERQGEGEGIHRVSVLLLR